MKAVKLSLSLLPSEGFRRTLSRDMEWRPYSALFPSAAVARLELATALLGSIEAKNIVRNRKNEKLFFLPNGYLEDSFLFFPKPYFSRSSVCACVSLWVRACSGAAWLARAVPLPSGCAGDCCGERCPTLLGQTACSSTLKIFKGFSCCSPVQRSLWLLIASLFKGLFSNQLKIILLFC